MAAPEVTVHVGDCVDSLRLMPGGSVHTCVTSPPYFGLRDYGVSGQIGLEGSLADYVAKLVAVFEEVRRVLRPDGTLWLNLGDSYAGSWGAQSRRGDETGMSAAQIAAHPKTTRTGSLTRVPGVKAKDLMGVPWRVAFGLQDAGWYLRQDIIWHKPNPMPESVRDRCTKAHEYLFLFAKSPGYYFDAEAVKEPAQDWGTRDRKNWKGNVSHAGKPGHHGCTNANHAATGKNKRSVWPIEATGNRERECVEVLRSDLTPEQKWEVIKSLLDDGSQPDVWRITPKPYKGAHFATFPPALVEPCVLAGTSAHGVCPHCGSPWVRETASERVPTRPGADSKVYRASSHDDSPYHGQNGMVVGNRDPQRHCTRTVTTGWRQPDGCHGCGLPPVPATVLDPFAGSGTTAEVAWKLGRSAVLCELNPEYVKLIEKRLAALDTQTEVEAL
jgi:DNA modification methylase